MALKSKHSKFAPIKFVLISVVAFGLVLASVAAFAQVSGEALWRVDSEKPAEPAPLYEGQVSPFPIELPPVTIKEKVAENQPTLSPQQMQAQQQAREAASRMSRIRDLLKDEEAFIPDVSGINIKAIAQGPSGAMALIKRNWFFEGDTIEAPVTTATQLLDLMSGLEQIDKNLANIVSAEVQARLESIGPRKMLIKKIKPTGVTLRRPDGKTIVISFVSQGW